MNFRVGKQQKTNGFTIVELLIVIVVIATLAAITIVSYNGIASRAYEASVQNDLRGIAQQVEMYRTVNGELPRGVEFQNLQIKVAKNAYTVPLFDTGSQYNLMYCSPTDSENAYAIVARSPSGATYRYGTAGSGEATLPDSESSLILCDAAGATTTGATDDDRQFLYHNGWQTWVEG